MNNILAAQVLRSHLPEITDGAYKTAMEIAIETLYLDAMDDWHRGAGKGLSAREYLELTEEEYCHWLLGREKVVDECSSREKELREKISEECSQKDSVNDRYDYRISQNNDRYDFRRCPDDFTCTKDYMFLELCDDMSNFDCEECWKNFLRGYKC